MKEIISMAKLGNPFGPSPVLEVAREQIINEAEQIGARKAAELLKIKLSEWLGVETEMIGLGHGSSEIIDILCQDFLAEQTVILPVPTYIGIAQSLKQVGSEIKPIPVGTDKGFSLDRKIAFQIIKESKAINAPIWLCNPNNPTGSYFDPRIMEMIVSQAPSWVMIDEAYLEYIDPLNRSSAITYIKQYPNVIVTKTFSKAFALPQEKMGVIVARPEVVRHIQDQTTTSLAESYIKTRYALDDLDHLKQFSQWLSQELVNFYKIMKTLGNIECSPFSVTGVMIIKHRLEALYELLKESNVKALDMDQEVGIEDEGYVRIGLQESVLNHQFLELLAKI